MRASRPGQGLESGRTADGLHLFTLAGPTPSGSHDLHARAGLCGTNGFKFQGTHSEFENAKKIVESWGAEGRAYKPTREYQHLLHGLRAQFNYRGDTNYAKMDRIVHNGIEEFKNRVYGTKVNGLTVAEWIRILAFEHADEARQAERERTLREALASHLNIKRDGDEIAIR